MGGACPRLGRVHGAGHPVTPLARAQEELAGLRKLRTKFSDPATQARIDKKIAKLEEAIKLLSK